MLSVVITTKNEAHIIGKTLQSVEGISTDIIIVDSGSTDETIAICIEFFTNGDRFICTSAVNNNDITADALHTL